MQKPEQPRLLSALQRGDDIKKAGHKSEFIVITLYVVMAFHPLSMIS